MLSKLEIGVNELPKASHELMSKLEARPFWTSAMSPCLTGRSMFGAHDMLGDANGK
jgi:hypothetical protein